MVAEKLQEIRKILEMSLRKKQKVKEFVKFKFVEKKNCRWFYYPCSSAHNNQVQVIRMSWRQRKTSIEQRFLNSFHLRAKWFKKNLITSNPVRPSSHHQYLGWEIKTIKSTFTSSNKRHLRNVFFNVIVNYCLCVGGLKNNLNQPLKKLSQIITKLFFIFTQIFLNHSFYLNKILKKLALILYVFIFW